MHAESLDCKSVKETSGAVSKLDNGRDTVMTEYACCKEICTGKRSSFGLFSFFLCTLSLSFLPLMLHNTDKKKVATSLLLASVLHVFVMSHANLQPCSSHTM